MACAVRSRWPRTRCTRPVGIESVQLRRVDGARHEPECPRAHRCRSAVYEGVGASSPTRAACRTRSATGWRSSISTWTRSIAYSRAAGCGRAAATQLGRVPPQRLPRACGAAAGRSRARQRVARRRQRPRGPIRLLTPSALRRLSCSIPSSFYYCFAGDGETLTCIVAEITNTPWNERHAYVLPVEAARRQGRVLHWDFAKTFHVSPFMPMVARYDWRFTTPGDDLRVHMNVCARVSANSTPRSASAPRFERRVAAPRAVALSVDDRASHRRHSLAGAAAVVEAQSRPRPPSSAIDQTDVRIIHE